MIKHCLSLALAAAALGWCARPLPADTPAAPGRYQLVWSDEFSKDGPPNPANWGFEQGFVRNEELQWYQPQNARCQKGYLLIEARREQVPNPQFNPHSRDWHQNRETAQYTSASLNTRNHHAWLYGRFEIRARIDTAAGSWPAFWTLGTSRGWPACGEVDIMEYYRRMVLANLVWVGTDRQQQWNSIRQPLDSFHDPHWDQQFHTWRMDWDASRIDLYLDDKLTNKQDLAKTLNAGRPDDNPFHRPMYILVNLAIGGQQGGDPSHTTFPLHYMIDYVRVYQTPAQIEGQKTIDHPAAPDTAPHP